MTGVTALLVGAGAVASRAARQLVETQGVESVLIASRRAEQGETLAATMGPLATAIQWSPDQPLPDGIDVVVCAVPTEAEFSVAEVAVSAGIPFVSTGDDPTVIASLHALDSAACDAGVPVVAGAGLAPGLSDVLARHAADALDSVDEINIARFGVAGTASRAAYKSACKERAMVVAGGVLASAKRSGHELVWFPDPVGARETTLVATGVGLLRAAFPGADIVRASAADLETSSKFTWLRKASSDGWGALRVEVWGMRGARREVVVYGVIERTAMASGTVLAVTAAALGGALPGLVATSTGTHGLGEIVSARAFLAELAERGVKSAVFEGVPVA